MSPRWIRVLVVLLATAAAASRTSAQPCCSCCQDTTLVGGDEGGSMVVCCQDDYLAMADPQRDRLLADLHPVRARLPIPERALVRTRFGVYAPEGETGKFTGVVTFTLAGGTRAYLQAKSGGPWSGVVVVRSPGLAKRAPLSPGDYVTVEGRVEEHWGRKLLETTMVEQQGFVRHGSKVRLPTIHEGPLRDFRSNATNEAGIMWERCLVRVPGPLVVTDVIASSESGGKLLKVTAKGPTTSPDEVLLVGVLDEIGALQSYAVGTVFDWVQGVLECEYPDGHYALIPRSPEDLKIASQP